MAWFKVDDALHSSRKVKSIPKRLRLPAMGLWVLCGSWSAQEELDGLVPDYIVDDFGGTPALVDALVKAGLWEPVEDGARFTKWGEYQPTRAEMDRRRAEDAERKRAARAAKSGKRPPGRDVDTARTPGGVGKESALSRPGPTRPDPSMEISPEGGGTRMAPWCSRHPGGTEDNCGPCRTARLAFEAAERDTKAPKPTTSGLQSPILPENCSRHERARTGMCRHCGVDMGDYPPHISPQLVAVLDERTHV